MTSSTAVMNLHHRFGKYPLCRTLLFTFLLLIIPFHMPLNAQKADQEEWFVHPHYEQRRPTTIAVLPMDNFSLDPDMEAVLYHEVYHRLQAHGYQRIAADIVSQRMQEFGIQTPGQLAGISLERLCRALGCCALLSGRVDQSGTIHAGVYDAVVVSCSLQLVRCPDGVVLWQGEQWRFAHRQWQLDPVNALINLGVHRFTARDEALAWLVQEMLKTMPAGPIQPDNEILLKKAVEINVQDP